MAACGITGSTGLIGKQILKSKIDTKFVKFKGNIKNKLAVYNWVKNNKFDRLIHLASLVSVRKAKNNYNEAKKINYLGTKYLVDAVTKYKPNLKLFFFTSTAHVYQLKRFNIAITENSKKKPFTEYGKTKLLAENYIIKKLKKAEIPYCIVRIFNIADKKQPKNFFYKSSLVKIKEKKNKTIKFENLNHFRDFINLGELMRIIEKMYKKKSTGIFNIGSGKKTSLLDLIKTLIKKYHKNLELKENNKKTYLIANIQKLTKELSLSKIKFDILKNL